MHLRLLAICRVTLLCWLLAALEHVFIVEQPGGSVWGFMERWQHFCTVIAYVSCICTRCKFSSGAIYLIFNTLCRKLDRLDSSSYCSAAALRCSSNAFVCEPLVQKVWSGLLCGQTVQESDISTWGGFRRLGSMETIMSGLIANICSCHKAMLPTCLSMACSYVSNLLCGFKCHMWWTQTVSQGDEEGECTAGTPIHWPAWGQEVCRQKGQAAKFTVISTVEKITAQCQWRPHYEF